MPDDPTLSAITPTRLVAREAVVEAMRGALKSSASYDYEAADDILDALLALPVEQRMEAMGMVPWGSTAEDRVLWTERA